MLMGQPTSYDEIPYSAHCFPYTHPDHLAVVGALFGMPVSPPDGCRLLEVGCARAGNLVPMAMELPSARFVGIDLSARQIAEGRSVVEKLGLDNVDLRAMSIMEVDESLGTFDYIVCHGVYSWVPEPVREKILAICGASLAADGVAYVSYNTYPGWHARGMVRELLAYHVRHSGGAHDRVRRARDFLDELVRVLPNPSGSYARILRTEEEFLRGVPNTYLYHEHLEETNHPVYFHEFIDRARAHGLGFLAEARTPGLADNLPAEAREVLERWTDTDDEIAREQYLDFLCNRTFRRSLLCHSGARRHPSPSPEALLRMSVSTGVVPASSNPDVASDAPEEFHRPEKAGSLTTNNPVVKAALVALDRVRPRSLTVAELWERVQAALGPSLGRIARPDEGPGTLAAALLRCFLSDLVDLHVQPPRFADGPGERPVASPLARIQSEESGRVTNLRRRTVELDEFDRLVLGQLDGSRDRSSVLEALRGLVDRDELTIYDGDRPIREPAKIDEILAAELEPSLRRLAGLALLIA
jgi:methyltransferase-like protein